MLLRVLKSRGMMGASAAPESARRDRASSAGCARRATAAAGCTTRSCRRLQRLRNRGLAKAWGGWTELTQIYAALARRGASAMGLSKAKRREAAWVQLEEGLDAQPEGAPPDRSHDDGSGARPSRSCAPTPSAQEKANRLLRAALLHQQATAWKKWDAQCSQAPRRARAAVRAAAPRLLPLQGWARVAERLRFAGSAERKTSGDGGGARMRSKAAPSFISWREWVAKRRMGDNNGSS